MERMRRKAIKAAFLAAMFAAWIAPRAATGATLIQVGREKNTCAICHGAEGKAWNISVHSKFEVTCTSCHGGNSQAIDKETAMSKDAGFRGKPTHAEIPALCASCHSDYMKMRQYGIDTNQLDEYKTSVHGKRLLENGDTNVAECASCHGSHDILHVSDPAAPVYPGNVPNTCAKCHGDKKLMAQYGISGNEPADYFQSVHADELMKKGNLKAPSCSSCHGNHGAVPPQVGEVVNICGKCHMAERDNFVNSPHFKNKIRCVNCHSNHLISRNVESILTRKTQGGCLSCHHDENSAPLRIRARLSDLQSVSLGILQSADKDIVKAAARGMDVKQLRVTYAAAQDGFRKFQVVQHSLGVRPSEETLSLEVNARADQIQNDVEVFNRAVLNRRIVMGIVAFFVLILVLIAYARHRIKKERKNKAG